MNETANESNSYWLSERCALRGAYSSCLYNYETARLRYAHKASSVWSKNRKDFNGADEDMYDFLMSDECIYSVNKQHYASLKKELDKNGYGHSFVPEHLDAAVRRFSAPHAPNAYYRPFYREMLQWCEKELKPSHLLLIIEFENHEDLRAFLSNPKASAGVLSCYSTAKKKKDAMTTEMFALLQQLEKDSVRKGTMNEPTMPATRLQVSMPFDEDGQLMYRTNERGKKELVFKMKTRLVNMVSLPRIVSEMHYSLTLQAYFGDFDWYAGGKTPEELWQNVNRFRFMHKYWDSLDYSAYDQSLPGWFIRDAFNIMKKWMRFENEYQLKRWDVMVHDFIHKGLVSDEFGAITRLHDGVESGSMFTQMIDTLCNMMMMVYFCMLKGKTMFEDCHCNICGDDNIVFHDGWFNGEDYLNTIRKVFGVEGNAAKSDIGRSYREAPKYLSREWRVGGVYRDPQELFVKLVYHEKWRRYDDVLTPALVVHAFIECYPLGMKELIDVPRFYMSHPNLTSGEMSKETAKAVGGIVAYESTHGVYLSKRN